jgi:hypothetical protein
VTTLSILLTRERNGPTDPSTMITTDPPTRIPTDPPTRIATDPPTAIDPLTTMIRFSRMSDVIGSSFEADFPNSPLQVSALVWFADTDPAKLPVDTDSTMLLERYTAALFYFATEGDGWRGNSDDWLSENPLCLWSGLHCTEEGFLTRISFSTPITSCLLCSICSCGKSFFLLYLDHLSYEHAKLFL